MLYAMLAACAILMFVLALPRAAEARRLARLFRAQEEWAEMMDRKTQPHRQCLAGRATGPRDGDESIVSPAASPALAVLLSGQPDGRRRA